MPEFILDTGDAGDRYASLDAFTRGYIEAMFFTETNERYDSADWNSPEAQDDIREGRVSGEIPHDATVADLGESTWETIKSDCERFQRENSGQLEAAYNSEPVRGLAYDDEKAGRDFWFTRNGHGVGFWDRGIGDVGDKLADICRKDWREVDLYRGDDGLIYLA